MHDSEAPPKPLRDSKGRILPGQSLHQGYRKKKLPKISEYLVENNLNPLEEILKLLPGLDDKDRVRVWMDLLKYVESPRLARPDKDEDEAPIAEVVYLKAE